MSQKSRTVADVSVGGWSPTPIYNRINEPTPDDEMSVASLGSPQGDAFEVKLDPVGLPITGDHLLRVRMRRTGPDGMAVRVELLQGELVVAARVFTPGGAFADYELLLSAAEVDRITDYADLRLRVAAFTAYSSSSASGSGSGSRSLGPIVCCPMVDVPQEMFFTVTSGNCDAGTTFELGNVIPLTLRGTSTANSTITYIYSAEIGLAGCKYMVAFLICGATTNVPPFNVNRLEFGLSDTECAGNYLCSGFGGSYGVINITATICNSGIFPLSVNPDFGSLDSGMVLTNSTHCDPDGFQRVVSGTFSV